MNLRRWFHGVQRGLAYFSSTAGALTFILSIADALLGGVIGLVVSVSISVGVGLICGCYGGRVAMLQYDERERRAAAVAAAGEQGVVPQGEPPEQQTMNNQTRLNQALQKQKMVQQFILLKQNA